MSKRICLTEPELDRLLRWKSALANCAIEGNRFAQKTLALWDRNRRAFAKIIDYLEDTE